MIGFLFFFLLQAEVERGLTCLYQNVETFSLFVGHLRSGNSLVAAILDSHPEIIISGEFNLLYKLNSFFMDPSETDDEGKLRTFFSCGDDTSRRHGGRFKALSKICYLSVSTCYYGQSYPEECG